MMTLSQAADALRVRGVLSASPEIPSDVLLAILADTARASLHAVSTAYSVGDKVLSPLLNGREYQCIIAGTSASTSPSWPQAGQGRLGQRITDGTATWLDVGVAYPEIYDINAASRECWLWRATQVAAKFDVSADGTSMKRSQLYDHAIAQARRYGWRGAL